METDSNIISKISEEETKKLIVKLGEAILVPPEQETHKGTLYFLSNLNQNFPAIVRTIYCYDKCEGKSSETACRVIRDAISKILVHYYPLAGRLVVGSARSWRWSVPAKEWFSLRQKLIIPYKKLLLMRTECLILPHPSIYGKLVYHFAGANDTLGTSDYLPFLVITSNELTIHFSPVL